VLAGAAQLNDTEPLAIAVTAKFVGDVGTVIGVAEAVAEAVPVPADVTALMRQPYAVPLASPRMTKVVEVV
jgi:hypothetical protein